MKIATPHNVRLVSEFGLSSELAVLEGHDVVYLVRQTTHLENYSLPIVGERLPAVGTASGLAILSCMAEGDYLTKLQELDSLKIWEQFGLNREDTLKKITLAKSLRYAYQADENILSEQSVAVALLGPGQTVLGAMSITGDRSKLEDLGLRKEIISRLQTTAKSISKMQLG